MLPILAAALIAAIWYGLRHAGNAAPSWLATGVKTASTALLALLGVVTGAPVAVILGLALGSAGDFALSRPGTRAFLVGMAAFALGHLAYTLEFAGRGLATPLSLPFWLVLGAMAGLVALTALWIAPKAGALAWPVRAYALAIAVMAASAALLPPAEGSATLQIGVAAFVASDLILALRLFVARTPRRRRLLARALWPLYWGGQALILWGALG